MTRFVSWAVSAGLVFAATAANAQMLAPYRAASDFDGPYGAPYGAPPPPAPPPVYNYGGYAPPLLPPTEVYAVLRDNGFSPLGIPHQRGLVYTIAVIDRNGEDGRLVIDARNGRIIRFVPAWGGNGPYGRSFGPERMGYQPDAALPPPTVIRGVPRPPASVPHVASRAVPLPAPRRSIAARRPASAQQTAAIETKPATPPPAPASAPPAANAQAHPVPLPSAQANAAPPPNTIGEAKAAATIRPTQPMPPAEGLE
ncbi:MAG TPA: hypothetical protein VKR55_09170 [Bradyrhizobium sp.]|uniref:hypothetical protein n=1 Tax=Bradyrhizobium sp. TaxID=376 RepID=UPI002CB2B4B3|nr:hypothetical protein [Bradyrhizobium sp.]HLZ02309.1 hypothetical protein [Bradyrhizobium sp.]